ncbi:MAG: hypothetical protein HYX68_17335 [Planctomycetes bacterium]|nr:hypothetical protein [Planctomycetota bacterium]
MKKLLLLCLALIIAVTSWTLAQSGSPNTWAAAQWVWDEADANKNPQNNEPRFFRMTFTLDAKPAKAELWITADNHYVAYVNGQKVGSDAEWNTVERYNVAKHLIVGKNVLAIKATNQGGPAGLIARLHVKSAGKKDHFIVTNEKTKVRRGEARVGDPESWTRADFDDSTWFNAIVLGDPTIGPWNLAGSPGPKGPGIAAKGYNTTEVVKVKGRLSAQEQMKHFVVPKDFVIELVAADPVIINPITMVMDDRGRIIVSESHTYRYGPPGSPIKPYANPVVRLDPDGKGGFKRTLIADGFADPVMGIAVKRDKLWLTANNYLYTYDLPPGADAPGSGKPLATNKKTIVTDLNKAWNPFGMFVLEWGPDGKLYMSVGNHNIKLTSPDRQGGEAVTGRGGSGIIVRMNPDGTKMERLVHGLRVPYSFEMDPFGQLWLLSNGEGNPNRFVRVIEGVDYHCYSRGGVGNDWLAGNHPLAPPCEELHRGANTQLMRYYGAAYPKEYQGNLFLCNWGAHGFAGNNRGIFRFVPDERNNISKREPLVWCKDPHFRPSHIMYDTDGSLLIADWYGRDDESDMTGRIWRLKYVGKNAPVVHEKFDSELWKLDDYAVECLRSPHHLIREMAMKVLTKRGDKVVSKLGEFAEKSPEPLGAAYALWTLLRIDTKEAKVELGKRCKHRDWKVRRLAANFLRNHPVPNHPDTLVDLLRDKDAAVLLEAGLAAMNVLGSPRVTIPATIESLKLGGAADPHLRYEAAWHLAKHADEKTITTLLTSDDANVRLAGLIAIDVACYENFPTKKAALAALAKALENPGKLDHQLLLEVARLDGDKSIVPALEKLIARDDLPTATIAKAVLVLKAKAGGLNKLSAAAGKRLIEAVEKGSLRIASPADQLVMFEFLQSEGPTPFALKQIAGQLRSNNKELRLAAHTLARRFGPKASSMADGLWPSVLNPKTSFADAIESLSTIARVEKTSKKTQWEELLKHKDPLLRMEAVRWWRRFDNEPEFIALLNQRAVDLSQKDARMFEELNTVGRQLSGKTIGKEISKDDLATHAVKEIVAMPKSDRSKRAAMGLQIFERSACTKCHTTATTTTLLAPSLKGVAAQKVEYLIESILYPSRIIKTGWEVELIELKSGRTLTGLVKDDGKHLRVLNLDKDERILKTDIDSRRLSKISVMPEGQHATLSRREFVDLIAYLQTLK